MKQALEILEIKQGLVLNHFPTIYSKDDVLRILKDIHAEIVSIQSDTPVTEELTYREVESRILDSLNSFYASDIVDFESANFCLNGNTIELEDIEIYKEDIAQSITEDLSNFLNLKK